MASGMIAPADCLLAVAHPDDDAIFAGELQRRLRGERWSVVCLTYTAESPRGREMLSWQTSLGTDPARIHFLAQPDPATDWPSRRSTIDPTAAADSLRALKLSPALIVTHNRRGEYGHPHHVLVHDLIAAAFPTTPRLCFGMGLDADLKLPCPDKRPQLERHYPSQVTAVQRVARATETFHWQVPAPAAPGISVFDRIAALTG